MVASTQTAFSYKELQTQLRQFRSLGIDIKCLLTHPYPILLSEVKRIASYVAKRNDSPQQIICNFSLTDRQNRVLDEWQSLGYEIRKLVPSPVCKGHLLTELFKRSFIPANLPGEFLDGAYPYLVEKHTLSLFVSPDGFQCKSNIVNLKSWACCPLFH